MSQTQRRLVRQRQFWLSVGGMLMLVGLSVGMQGVGAGVFSTPRNETKTSSCSIGGDGSPVCGSTQDALDVGAWGVEGLKGGFGQGGDVNYELMENVAKGSAAYQLARGVGLLWVLDNEQKEWIPCTAFLISEEHLLTAGHCVMKVDGENEWRKIGQAKFVLGYLGEAAAKAKSPGFDVVGKGMVSLDLHLGRACDASENATESKKTEAAKPEHRDTDAHYRASDKDQGLDYALLGLCPGEFQRKVTQSEDEDVRRFGPVDIAEVALEEKHDLLLIHHPERFRQVLTQRYCRTVDQKDGDPSFPANFRHLCDTHGGSSGAPIFSRRHEAVTAIHTCCTYHHGDAAELAVSRFNRAVHIAAVAEVNDVVRRLMIKNPLTAEQRQANEFSRARALQSLSESERNNYKLAAFLALDGLEHLAKRKSDAELLLKSSSLTEAALTKALLHMNELSMFARETEVLGAEFDPSENRVLVSGKGVGARVCELKMKQPECLGIGDASNNRQVFGAFSEDGTKVLLWSNGTARIYDAVTREPVSAPLNHGGALVRAKFNNDASRVLTYSPAGSNFAVKIWDVATGQMIGDPLKHQGKIQSADFSPDGSQVLTASSDKTARVWDANNGHEIVSPMLHGGIVSAASYDHTGNRILTSSWDGFARIWDARTGLLIVSCQSPAEPNQAGPLLRNSIFSPDGERLLTIGWFEVRLWRSSTCEQIGLPLRHDDSLSASFSPDGTKIVTWSTDRTARVWSAMTAEPLSGPIRHEAVVSHAIFSEDGRRIATGTQDGKVRVWDPSSGEPITPWLGHGAEIATIAFNRHGDKLMSSALDGARLWQIDLSVLAGREISHVSGESISNYRFSPSESHVLTWDGEGALNLWRLSSGAREFAETQLSSDLVDVEFSNDGAIIHTIALDGTYTALRSNDGTIIRKKLLQPGIKSAHFNRGATRLVSSSNNERSLWDTETLKDLHRARVEEVDDSFYFSPDGELYVEFIGDNHFQIRDSKTGSRRHDILHRPVSDESTVFSQSPRIINSTFSPDGTLFLSALDDGSIRGWNTDTGIERFSPIVLGENAASLDFRMGGLEILISSRRGETSVYDAFSGQQIGPSISRQGRVLVVASGVFGARYSPDGTKFVAASLWDRSAFVYDASSLAAESPALAHEDFVSFAEFSADGSKILTQSVNSFRVWDSETGTPLSPLFLRPLQNFRPAFSPDGYAVIAPTADGTATIHDIPPIGLALVATAKERLAGLKPSPEECQQYRIQCDR